MLAMFMALIDSIEQQTKFERIYNSYRKQMISVAKKILQNNESAEDAVQEAFINIAKQIEHIKDDDERKVRAYVFTAVQNAAIYIHKQELKNQHNSILYEAVDDELLSNPENQIMGTETINELKEAIRKLPTIYQDVLLMRLIHELEYSEIADALHRTESTVRQQTVRAKNMLAELCVKEGLYVCV